MPSVDRGSHSHRTRFEPARFSTVWQNIVSRLTPPSHPSATSESAIGSALNTTDNGHSESPHVSNRALELLNPKHGTEGRHKHQGVRRRFAKSSQGNTASRYGDDEDNRQSYEPLSHVVVEADFDHFSPQTARSDSGSTVQTHGFSAFEAKTGKATKGNKLSASKPEGEEGDNDSAQGDSNEVQSIRRDRRESWWARTAAFEWIFERLWPNIKHFMDSSFPEAKKEHSFQKEVRSVPLPS